MHLGLLFPLNKVLNIHWKNDFLCVSFFFTFCRKKKTNIETADIVAKKSRKQAPRCQCSLELVCTTTQFKSPLEFSAFLCEKNKKINAQAERQRERKKEIMIATNKNVNIYEQYSQMLIVNAKYLLQFYTLNNNLSYQFFVWCNGLFTFYSLSLCVRFYGFILF